MLTRPSSPCDAPAPSRDELGDQPVHELGQAVRGAFDLRVGARAPARDRKQRGVEGHVIGRAHDAPEQELAGAEPAGQAERGALGEIVRIGARGPPPGGHHRARVRGPRAALAGQPGRDQVDHSFAQVAQSRSRAADPERDDGDQVRVERGFGRGRRRYTARASATSPSPPAARATIWRRPRGRGRRGHDGRLARPPGVASAWAKSAAVGKRSAGALASARITLRSTPSGTVARTVRSGGTGSIAWRASSCWAVGPTNGGWPASISYSTQPSAYRSLRPSSSLVGGGLLRAHVGGGAEGEPGLGQPVLAGGRDGARHPEVRHHRLVAFQQDVLRLDVAVDDAVRVGVAQGAQHLGGDAQGLVERKLALACHPLPEGLALHVRHGIPQPAGGLARVVHGEDVRMLQAGGDPDLLEESLRSERGGELGAQDLERDGAIVPEVVREVDHGHAAAAELALDAVAVGQGGREEGGCVGQEGWRAEDRRMPVSSVDQGAVKSTAPCLRRSTSAACCCSRCRDRSSSHRPPS